ncbi:MAG TPA: carboxypeptidase-like regulatory domain-containing protein [Dehalococcoidia bacterium]|nr:carboxypeptidase-like regulatory domain-containing protein [Dehalococcoidia bacterium]
MITLEVGINRLDAQLRIITPEPPFTIEGICFSKIGGPFCQDELVRGTYYPIIKVRYEEREGWPVRIILDDLELIIKGPSSRSDAHLFDFTPELDAGKTTGIGPHTPPNGVGHIANILAANAGIYTFTTKLHYQGKEILSHTEEVIVGGAESDFGSFSGVVRYSDGSPASDVSVLTSGLYTAIYDRTDSAGEFSIPSISIGKRAVDIGPPGTQTTFAWFETFQVDIQLGDNVYDFDLEHAHR